MTVEIEGVTLHLAHPDEVAIQWVGQDELMRQLLAAWMVVNEQDLPMNPRLLGKPGVGKTTLAYAAGRRMGRDVYILQATLDTRPEDLLVTPVIEGGGNLRYVASPLVTAMIKGGIAIVDEGNRMSEKSWASLAPLLDKKRSFAGVPMTGDSPEPRVPDRSPWISASRTTFWPTNQPGRRAASRIRERIAFFQQPE